MASIIVEAFRQAIQLIFSGDPDVWSTVYRSLYVTSLGTLLACLWSIPIAIAIGLYAFRGRWFIKGFFNAMIGVPTVALGLLLYLLMSEAGILGPLNLLYTLNGIAVGQAILLTPIIVSFSGSALAASDSQIRDLTKTLGASPLQTDLKIMKETTWSLVLAVTAAFNRGFGELGIAMIVGGNIYRETRVLTTAIAVESNMGNFVQAMAYGIILITIVIALTLFINLVERLKADDIPETRGFRKWATVIWR